uniref:Uncharacterized protein n=2 Tax=Rhizophora mucronata TaxID=61149 RepID=A0A2P2LTP1_RHIMU
MSLINFFPNYLLDLQTLASDFMLVMVRLICNVTYYILKS